MKKIIALCLFIGCFSVKLSAQYNKPYRICYNQAGKSFLICNRGNGSITELDSNFKTRQVITGLTDPRDLRYATIGTTAGLVILDDNKLKVYDASFNHVINFSIGSAQNAEALIFDPAIPGIFYISDKKGNQIIEGKIGAAPFYIPSFRTLAGSGVHRPAGLLIDRQGRLLYVEDSLNAGIMQVNKSSGAVQTLFRTGIDSANSIEQDREGNYYMSNWSDSYVYRIKSDLKAVQRLAGFSRPSGLVVEPDLDLLLICCTNCGKVDFQKLHWFEPLSDQAMCSGDSGIIECSPLYQGIGTFLSGNRFIVELSDSTGSFAKPLQLGFVEQDSNPIAIPVFLPQAHYGTRHSYRLHSTKPVFYSSSKNLTVFPHPEIRAFSNDSAFTCTGTALSMGSAALPTMRYNWTPGKHFTDSTRTPGQFLSQTPGFYACELQALDTLYGCRAQSAVLVVVRDTISIPGWQTRYRACEGSTTEIGTKGYHYQFNWSPESDLSDANQSDPVWTATRSRRYQVLVTDTLSGCRGTYFVDVQTDSLPVVSLADSLSVCANEPLLLGEGIQVFPAMNWSPERFLDDATSVNPIFKTGIPGDYRLSLEIRDHNQCAGRDSMLVICRPLPDPPEIGGIYLNQKLRLLLQHADSDSLDLYGSQTRDGIFDHLGRVKRSDSILLDTVGWQLTYKWFVVEIRNTWGCPALSDTVEAELPSVSARQITVQELELFPNPAARDLFLVLPFSSTELSAELHTITGHQVARFSLGQVPAGQPQYLALNELALGFYLLSVKNVEGRVLFPPRPVWVKDRI